MKSIGLRLGEWLRDAYGLATSVATPNLNEDWGVQLVTDVGDIAGLENAERRQLHNTHVWPVGIGTDVVVSTLPYDLLVTDLFVFCSALANITHIEVTHRRDGNNLQVDWPMIAPPAGAIGASQILFHSAGPPTATPGNIVLPAYRMAALASGRPYLLRKGEAFISSITVAGAPTTANVFVVASGWVHNGLGNFWPRVS